MCLKKGKGELSARSTLFFAICSKGPLAFVWRVLKRFLIAVGGIRWKGVATSGGLLKVTVTGVLRDKGVAQI